MYCSASWQQHKISNQNTLFLLKMGAVTAETIYKMGAVTAKTIYKMGVITAGNHV